MTRLFLTIAASSLALAACGEPAANTGAAADTRADGAMTGETNNAMGAMTTSTDSMSGNTLQGYIDEAASADQYQIQSSQLMLEKSKNAEVKRFAQFMLTDHGGATVQLKAASQRVSLTAPHALMMPKHQVMLDDLRQAGTNMDQMYLEQQRTAHAEIIALHQGMTNGNSMPEPLGAFARDMLPRVEAHARMLNDIKI